MFFVQHQCFWFQNQQVKKHKCLVERGVATKRFFYEQFFAKSESNSFFGHILVDAQKALEK